MSVDNLASGKALNEWTPSTILVGTRLEVDSNSIPSYPENFLYIVTGLSEPAFYEDLDRFIRNGDLIWYDQQGNVYSYSQTGSNNKYSSLKGKPTLGTMSAEDDVTGSEPMARIKGEWVPAKDPVFKKWYPEVQNPLFGPFFTNYVPKQNDPILGKLLPTGNKLTIKDFNTGNSNHLAQYVIGKQQFDFSNPIALYFKFDMVPTEFNAIDLAVGFYRTPSGLQASPLQQERFFKVDGIIVANEIIIDGIGGVALQNQVRYNFLGSLKDVEFCLAYLPGNKLAFYIDQEIDPLAEVEIDEFYVDSILAGLDVTYNQANKLINLSVEILNNPNTIQGGLGAYQSSQNAVPYVNQDQYPTGRNGKLYEVAGLSETSLLAELGILIQNGDTIWFDSEGNPRVFNHEGFSGKYKDLEGLPNIMQVALSNDYYDLFNLPPLGTASAKDIEYFQDLDTETLTEAKEYTDDHTARENNPHNVTKDQVGLDNVTNDAQLKASQLDTDQDLTADSDILVPSQKAVKDYVDSHKSRTDNPHQVTKLQVGLANVDNTADVDKPVSVLQQQAINQAAQVVQNDLDGFRNGLGSQIAQAKAEAIASVLQLVLPIINQGYSIVATITDDYLAQNKEIIPVDTTSKVINLTLPASPNPRDSVRIFNYGDTFDTNNLIIKGNGEMIANSLNDYVVDVGGAALELTYIDSLYGWMVQ